ncbi:hypothetical protein ACWD4G_37835 [Streptomyces sp. NPDC002643]
MRRTARVLSAAFVTGTVMCTLAPSANAESEAQADPHTVLPGADVTISVACDPTGAAAPETIDAASQAFERGTVTLQRLPGGDASTAGPSYQGTARIAPAADFEARPDAMGGPTEWAVDGLCPAASGGQEKQWSAAFTVEPGSDPNQPAHQPLDDYSTHQPPAQSDPYANDQPSATPDPYAKDHSSGQPDPYAKEHPPAQPDHHGTSQPDHRATHTPAPVQRGVEAGGGGAFTDSVPAMVAGGLLIVGALGAGVQRLRDRAQSKS